MIKKISLLSGVGFAAIKAGDFASATTIFESIKQLGINNATADIGLASIAMAKGQMQEASSHLDQAAFSDMANAHEAKKLLLLASMMGGDKAKAAKVHQSLVDSNARPPSEQRRAEAREFFTV